MIIKKFQGRTKEEALESARRELGANIVEMNVKALKPKGIMGLFRGTRFEVTVAREEENEKYSAASAKDVQKDGVAVSFSHNEPQGKIIPMKKAEEKEDARAVGLAVADVLSTYQPETARDEGVKEGIQVKQFFPFQIYNFLCVSVGPFELRLKCFVYVAWVISFMVRPAQEPPKKGHIFRYGSITKVGFMKACNKLL